MSRLQDRAEQAYMAARPMIDSYSGGLPDRDELPDRDRALCDELARAEAAVQRYREQHRIP